MQTDPARRETATLEIEGMRCGHCAQAVTEALAEVPGIRTVSVAVGSAVIEATDGRGVARAIGALAHAGYPATVLVRDPKDGADPRGCSCCALS